MKKVLLAVAVVAAFGMTSCGGPDVCDCVNLEYDEEGKPKDEDLAKKCEEMGKDKSEEEIEEMMKEAEKCEKKDEE